MARMRNAVLLLLVVAAVAAGCGSDDGGTTTDQGSGDAGASFEMATYNAGLADGFVDHARERAPLVSEAIEALGADAVFVQEVWTADDVAALTGAVTDVYPDSFFLDPMPDDPSDGPAATDDATTPEVSCSLGEAVPLEDCAREHCADLPADQIADCVLSNCGAELGATCPTCQACLAANVGSSIDEAIVACTQGTAAYAYDGSFGIGFLSSEPFVQQDQLVLESSLTRRAVLYVEIDDPTIGPVHLFGTHLSPVFSDVPYPGEGSWEEEQAAQIETLRAWVDEKAGDGVVIMAGDFNTGPAGDLYEADQPDNYASLVAGDWSSPYADDPTSECTFCADNALVEGDSEGDVAIDHVLVANFDGAVDARRVVDGEVEVVVDGETITTAVSDHYGVLVSLTP